jgi:hypothetical protein
MKYFLFILLMFLLSVSLFARDIHYVKKPKILVLKDGSILYGIINPEKSTHDSINFSTPALKNLMINKENIKFFGLNLNNGFMLGAHFDLMLKKNNEKNYDIKYSLFISSTTAFNSHIATGFDVVYFNKFLRSNAIKYLYHDDKFNEGIPVEGKYQYGMNFIIPNYTIRFNFLPSFIKQYTDNISFYPYVSLGGGPDIGLVKTKLVNRDSLEINNQNYNIEDISQPNHYYFGLNYKYSFGFSFKIITKLAFVFEYINYHANYKEYLSATERDNDIEPDKFTIKGYTFLTGLRFGNF